MSDELSFNLMMSYSGNVSLQDMLMGQMQLVWCIAKAEGFSLFFYSDPATPLNQFVYS